MKKSRILSFIIGIPIILVTVVSLLLLMTVIELPSWTSYIVWIIDIPLIWYIRYKLENKYDREDSTKNKKLIKEYPEKFILCPDCGQPNLKENVKCSYCGALLK